MLVACCSALFCVFLVTSALFFSPIFLELWVILNRKSLHYKTIISEASGNTAGIRCSLPTAAVRDGGGERIWMGGAIGWQQRREDCKSTSMSHWRGHISSSFFGLDGMHRTSCVSVFKSWWSLPICVFYCVKTAVGLCTQNIVSIKVLDMDHWSLILMSLIPLPGGFVHKAS